MPLLKTITTTIIILQTLWIWNDFLLPFLILYKRDLHTIPLSVNRFFGQYLNQWDKALPALQRFAEQGCAVPKCLSHCPSCSPSRASFMTGMYPHSCGMLGLAHRGFSMESYDVHIVHTLKDSGYLAVISGVEHTAPDLSMIGYDRILSFSRVEYSRIGKPADPAEAAVAFLLSSPQNPFFLSVGLMKTHRPFPKADPDRFPAEAPRFCQPPEPLPNTPQIRADMADFKAAVRIMDDKFGLILAAL